MQKRITTYCVKDRDVQYCRFGYMAWHSASSAAPACLDALNRSEDAVQDMPLPTRSWKSRTFSAGRLQKLTAIVSIRAVLIAYESIPR